MKTYTLQDIRDLSPCYDPVKYLAEDWSGTLIDILNVEECSAEDKLWVVTQLLDDKTNRLFAVYCARTALALVPKPDPRSVAAIDIAEKYAHGRAPKLELQVARDAAEAADGVVARVVVGATVDAAGAAARDAARGAAWAAEAAAWAATRAAVWAAEAAVWAAAWVVGGDVVGSTVDAAAKAAWTDQLATLKEMISTNNIQGGF